MDLNSQFLKIAGLIGEPVRAGILWSLMQGRALTASELAISVDISPQGASMHLKKLVEADLLRVEVQGRHRYFTFAKPEVAEVIESLAGVAGIHPDYSTQPGSRLPGLRFCRTCYDHLAGIVGVRVTDQLIHQKLMLRKGKSFEITRKGEKWFEALGISIAELKTKKRTLARPCMDWTERRLHLAGALGASMTQRFIELGWLVRSRVSRSMSVTPLGYKRLHEELKLII